MAVSLFFQASSGFYFAVSDLAWARGIDTSALHTRCKQLYVRHNDSQVGINSASPAHY